MLSAPPITPATRQPTFYLRVHPAPARGPHVLARQRGQARPLTQRHHLDQDRLRHEMVAGGLRVTVLDDQALGR